MDPVTAYDRAQTEDVWTVSARRACRQAVADLTAAHGDRVQATVGDYDPHNQTVVIDIVADEQFSQVRVSAYGHRRAVIVAGDRRGS